MPDRVSVFPALASRVLEVAAVNVTAALEVTLPVANKVPPPKVIPPVPLLILAAEAMDRTPALIVVPPV